RFSRDWSSDVCSSDLHQYGAIGEDYAHGAVSSHFEGLVVRAIFLGLLRHQAYVRHAAHGGWVEGAVGFAEVDHFLVDAGVSALRHYRLGVLELAVLAPHLPGAANHRRHRSIDDNVAWDVQVGDALDRVDHGHFRAMAVAGMDVVED